MEGKGGGGAESKWRTPGRPRDLLIYGKLLTFYLQLIPSQRTQDSAWRLLRSWCKANGKKVPTLAICQKWLTYGVKIPGYPILEQDVRQIASAYDRGEFNPLSLTGNQDSLGNTVDLALTSILQVVSGMAASPDFTAECLKNPDKMANLLGKVAEIKRQVNPNITGKPKPPAEMSDDEAIDLLDAILQAKPHLQPHLKELLK